MSNNQNNTQAVNFDTLRSLAYTSVSGSYAAIGTPFLHIVRMLCITNDTDGDMLFSLDGVHDQIVLIAGSAKIFDFNTNRTNRDQLFALQENTQFYVRYASMPTKGTVYVECMWGQ